MSPPTCFLVDLDDTLYPELSYVESGYRAVADHLASIHIVDAEAVHGRLRYEMMKFGRTGAFDRLFCHFGWMSPPLNTVVEVYRNHTPSIAYYPGAREALAALREIAPVAIVTDGTARVQSRKVKALAVADDVDAVVLCDDFGFAKPDPAGFVEAARLLNRSIQGAVIIGDDPYHDLEAALRLGVDAVRVRTGRLAGLDVVHHFREALDIAAAARLVTAR